jgi:hypothetical protein
MVPTKYLLDHIDALLRLSHEVNDRAVSAKLREMADEIRIMVSVAYITDMVAALNKTEVPPADDFTSQSASGATTGPKPKRKKKVRPVKRLPKT